MLTELEGAILSEIVFRGNQTAFQVRRSFAESPSLEWKGSAGAVYPAVRRLESQGLITAIAKGDGRSTKILSVTPTGRKLMLEWACEPQRAVSTGIDPFRMRSGIWLQLDRTSQRRILKAVLNQLEVEIEGLRAYSRRNDAIENASVDLATRLQEMRRDWIEQTLQGRQSNSRAKE